MIPTMGAGLQDPNKALRAGFSLVVTMLALGITGQPAWANELLPIAGGRFQVEISNSAVAPKCLALHAGGSIGPGSGVTVQNRCDVGFTIQSIQEVGKPPPADGYVAYLFIKPGTTDQKLISSLKFRSTFKPCTQFLPESR